MPSHVRSALEVSVHEQGGVAQDALIFAGRKGPRSLSTTEIPSCCCMLLVDSFSLLSGISVGVYCIWLPIHLFMRNLVVFSFGLL